MSMLIGRYWDVLLTRYLLLSTEIDQNTGLLWEMFTKIGIVTGMLSITGLSIHPPFLILV